MTQPVDHDHNRYCGTYFDLQYIISAEPLIVHLMVGIICISTTLILDKSETDSTSATFDRERRRRNNRCRKLTVDWQLISGLGYRIAQGVRSFCVRDVRLNRSGRDIAQERRTRKVEDTKSGLPLTRGKSASRYGGWRKEEEEKEG